MASGALMNSSPSFGLASSKEFVPTVDNRWAGGVPLLQSEPQQRTWVPDGRDAFISWLRAEFAAANAMIDSLCHHLQLTGKPGEYDFVLACIQQRRCNWNAVLHMQQYFSIAEVIFALQQVILRKQQMQSFDRANLYMPQAPPLSEDRNFSQKINVQRIPTQDYTPTVRNPSPQNLEAVPKSFGESSKEDEFKRKDKRTIRSRGEDTHKVDVKEPPSASEPTVSHVKSQAQVSSASGSSNEGEISLRTPSPGLPTPPRKRECEDNEQRKPEAGEVSQAERRSSHDLGILEGKFSNNGSQFSNQEEEAGSETMKAIGNFSCFEQIDGKLVNVVEGMELYKNVLDKEKAAKLVTSIYEVVSIARRGKIGGLRFIAPKRSTKMKGKKNIQFGSLECSEDEDQFQFNKDEALEPMPAFLQEIIDSLIQQNILPAGKRPDCCKLNVLEEGDYVPPYLMYSDFEKPLCILTLVSESTAAIGRYLKMEDPGQFLSPFKLILPVGSVLVFHGNSSNLARLAISASPVKRLLLMFGKTKTKKFPRVAVMSTGNASSIQSIAAVSGSPLATSGSQMGIFRPSGQALSPASLVSRNHTSVSAPPMCRPPLHHVATQFAQPAVSSPPGQAGPYPPIAIPASSWAAVPGPVRLHTTGTGVFLPSSGLSGQPTNCSQGRQIFTPASPLQKTNSSPAALFSLDTPESSVTSRPSRSKTLPPRNDGLDGTEEHPLSAHSAITKDPEKGLVDGNSRSDGSNARFVEVKQHGTLDGLSNSGYGVSTK